MKRGTSASHQYRYYYACGKYTQVQSKISALLQGSVKCSSIKMQIKLYLLEVCCEITDSCTQTGGFNGFIYARAYQKDTEQCLNK